MFLAKNLTLTMPLSAWGTGSGGGEVGGGGEEGGREGVMDYSSIPSGVEAIFLFASDISNVTPDPEN